MSQEKSLDVVSDQEKDYAEEMKKKYYKMRTFFYPNRPLFTLAVGFVFFGLSWVGLLPAATAIWIGSIIVADDIAITPIIRLAKLFRNLSIGRKETKSMLAAFSIIAGYIVGLTLGVLIFSQFSGLIALVPGLREAFGSSLTFVFVATGLGVLTSEYMHWNPVLTVGIFISILPWISVPAVITPVIDIMAGSLLLGGFLSAILSKQFLRLAYYYKNFNQLADGTPVTFFGKTVYLLKSFLYLNDGKYLRHSNGDGYYQNLSYAKKATDIDARQAAIIFDVNMPSEEQVKQVRDMRVALLDILFYTRAETSAISRVIGFEQLIRYSYKDILHLLMTAKDQEDVTNFKALVNFEAHQGEIPLSNTLLAFVVASQCVESHYQDSPAKSMQASFGLQANTYVTQGEKAPLLKEKLHGIFASSALEICESGSQSSKEAVGFFEKARDELNRGLSQ